MKNLVLVLSFICVSILAISQNPFPATVLTNKNSTSAYATSLNAFHTNNCGTGSQDLHGQCTWYAEGRVQELAAAGKLSSSSASIVHNAMCPAGMSRNAKNWDDIIGGTWYSTASQALPLNLRNPGMLIIWEFGAYGHVAFVEEVSADKTQYRISEYNVGTALGYTSSVWLPFQGNDTRGWGVYPKFFPLQTTTQPAAQPTLQTPAVNASNLTGNINFTWTCPNATEYRIQIIEANLATTFSTANGFSGTFAYNNNIGNVQSFLWTGAQPGKTYYWSVRANNSAGTSGFAPYRSFTTTAPATTLTVTPSSQNVGSTAGNTSFSVSTNASTWNVTSNSSWATASKSGNTISVWYQANTSTAARTATLTITAGNQTKYVYINQAGAVIQTTLTVTPSSQNVGSTAGNTSFSVSTNASTYNVSSNGTWATASKSGNTISVWYQTNTSTASRTATLTITAGNQTKYVYINQAGAAPATCNTPSGLYCVSKTKNSMSLSWSGVSGATSYHVDVKASFMSNWTTYGPTSNTSGTISGLTGGYTYNVRVRANCSNGLTSAWSSIINVQLPTTLVNSGNGNGTISNATERTSTIDELLPENIEILKELNIKVYPNPNNGLFSVNYLGQSDTPISIQVIDLQGRIINTQNIEATRSEGEGQVSFDLSNEQNGLYFVKVLQGDLIKVEKIQIIK